MGYSRSLLITQAAIMCLFHLAFAGDNDPAARAPVFNSQECKLIIQRMELKSDMKFSESPPATHSVEFEGVVKTPVKLDVVAIRKIMKIKQTVNKQGKTIKALDKIKSPNSKYKSGTYTYVEEKTRLAEAEIKRLELRSNPYTIKSMDVETTLVVARKRGSAELPATISSSFKTVAKGLKLKVTALTSKRNNVLKVTADYERSASGPQIAFLDTVHCLKEDGKPICGGRINDGDPMGEKGKLDCEFTLPDISAIKTLKFGFVTESQLVPVIFQLEDVFQR